MKRRLIRQGFFLCGFAIFLFAHPCAGGEPYDNVAMPQGSYFSVYPLYSAASRLMDKDGHDTEADPRFLLYQNTFKYNYYDTKVFPHTAVLSALLPVGCIEIYDDRACGVGDLTLVGGYWLVDDPVARTWLGTRAQVVVPTGSFRKGRKANMGGNVWRFRPILYAAKQIGKLHAELTLKYTFFTKNRATDTKQGDERCAEGYVGYFLRPDLLAGAHLNAVKGREKTVAGLPVRDSGVRIFQAGASVFKSYGSFSVLLEALTDFGVRNSLKAQTILARLSWKL